MDVVWGSEPPNRRNSLFLPANDAPFVFYQVGYGASVQGFSRRRLSFFGGYGRRPAAYIDSESAIAEVVGYVAKPPAFETTEAEVEYLAALKGSRLIQPFGSVHGNVPKLRNLLQCADCETAPAYWNYLGYVDGCYDTMTLATDGDRPPPGSD
jgi:hypothetical protein